MKEVVFPNTASGSPDSPEWHAWRAKGLGGSDSPPVAAEAGLCARASWMPTSHQLWEMKVGLRARPQMNPAMMRGRKFEAPARLLYEATTGIVVSPVFGEMDDHPELRTSFDGVTFDNLTNVEIKVPSAAIHAGAKTGVAPEYYEAQMAHQGLVLWGRPSAWSPQARVHFVSYQPPEKGVVEDIAIVEYSYSSPENSVRMDRLKALADKMLPLLLNFWQHVELNTPPGEQMDEWSLAAHNYRKADQAEEAAKTIKDAAKKTLLGLVGDSPKRSGAGVSVSTYPQQGSVDYKKVVDAAVDFDLMRSELKALLPEMEEASIDAILAKAKITDDKINTFRGADSIRTKISVEKDYIPPAAAPVLIVEVPAEVNGEKSYAW